MYKWWWVLDLDLQPLGSLGGILHHYVTVFGIGVVDHGFAVFLYQVPEATVFGSSSGAAGAAVRAAASWPREAFVLGVTGAV